MLSEKAIRTILAEVTDPEIPVLTIEDMGIIRQINTNTDLGSIEVQIMPTYSGCPAMDTIAADIQTALKRHGATQVTVSTVLSPAWTSDLISIQGREKLRLLGIAPPQYRSSGHNDLSFASEERHVPCPYCQSTDTQMISRFGSTACKALYKCNTCLEPFDYFKCH